MKGTSSKVLKSVLFIKPDAHTVSTVTGVGVDCQGFRELLARVDVGDDGAAGLVDFKLQETGVDSAGAEDTANYADITGAAIAQTAGADQSAIISMDLEKRKRFIRAIMVVAGNTLDAGASGVLSQPQYPPVTQSVDETVLVN